VPVDRPGRLSHEFDECVLHHIARTIDITGEEARGVADERSLLVREGAWQKTGVFIGVIPSYRGGMSHGSYQLDAPRRIFLEKIFACNARRRFPPAMPPRLPLLLSVLAALVVIAGCGKRQNSAEEGIRTKTLLLGNLAEPRTLDPQVVTAYTDMNILVALFEGLTALDEKTSRPIPAIADRWEISPDGLVYTFHLRPDARWSNGDPLTSHDFAYSFQRVLTPAFGSEYSYMLWAIKNAEAFNTGKLTDFSQVGVATPDNATLRLTLAQPTPYLLSLAAHNTWYPVHRATIEKFGRMDQRDTPWTRPGNFVGNGPFTLAEWSPNARVVAAKNPHYWGAANTALERVVFFPTESPDVEERNFRAGQVHVTYNLPTSKIAGYRQREPEKLRLDPLLATFFLYLNVSKPPLDNPKLRCALSLAIDRETISRNVLNGSRPPAASLVPDNCAGYISQSKVPHDYAAARQLLGEAGYPGGQGLPVFEVMVRNDDIQPKIMEAIQEMWRRELGVRITIAPLEQKILFQNQQTLNYTISFGGWTGDFMDPVTFLDLFLKGGGNNWSGWSHPEYDRLIAEAAGARDNARRFAIFQQAETLLLGEAPIAPVFFNARTYLIHPAVKNWEPALLGLHRYQLIKLEK
jgi:oligopeptide transport system substrate-binding protein